MTTAVFYKYLSIVTVCTSALLGAAHFTLWPMRQHWPLSIITVLAFVLVSLGLFIAGRSAAKSTNKVAFNGLVSGSVFGKMFLAVGLLLVYQQIWKPDNQWFVGIFLLVYVVYTVFEVWFMTKLARMS